jgi:hypothetical protein
MSRFAGEMGSDERGREAGLKSQRNAAGSDGGSSFGRRRELPDADLMRVLNTGSSGASPRTPRSISPPLVD